MIDRERLLADLQKLVRGLEDDLRERCDDQPEIDAPVRAEYERARAAQRTAHPYAVWRDEYLTQVAVAWVLACVFIRFLEDNDLVDSLRLAGPGPRLGIARDHHTEWFSKHPTETDREYLRFVFSDAARLPALERILGEAHNPLFTLGLSSDGARELLAFWQRIDPASGALVHDFTDPALNTRFLGDLYQDLSKSARKTYALLQTPHFVEEFLLDRTLEPAIQEFGYQAVRLIDPACGSGHLLLGAFARLFARWSRDEPATNSRELAQRTLNAVHGVDLNPFAVAIARFRLLIAALQACEIKRLADAPGFRINLAVGDSLLHGPRLGHGRQEHLLNNPLRHVYETEDAGELNRILGQRYHVVVANPPYITVKDAALNQAYRDRFGSCHMKYSLAVPFMERFFDLAIASENAGPSPAGFVGMITANSFMKREFGKKLIDTFMPRWDLTNVIDTSRAYIPGYGTPTVILFARNRPPLASVLRAVMGIRGEPETPDDPAKGLVWTAILGQIDQPDSQSDFVSVGDVPRQRFHSHPWNIGGGGAADLKQALDEAAELVLGSVAESIGITSFTLEDDVFLLPPGAARRHQLQSDHLRRMVIGDSIRDWALGPCDFAVFPYDISFRPIREDPGHPSLRYLWPARTQIANNKMFGGKTKIAAGLKWYEFGRLTTEKLRTPLSIAFAFVATHNHFVLDRGGKVFKQTAPVIKLPRNATEDDHLGLLGILNSSTACFWMKQVLYNRGGGGIGGGLATEEWEQFVEHDAAKLLRIPLSAERPLDLAQRLDIAATDLIAVLPDAAVASGAPTRQSLLSSRGRARAMRERMVAIQEELDWRCYQLYRLLDENLGHPSTDVPPVRLGERAFEIVLARKIAAGEVNSTWFERHGSTPLTAIPDHWPEDYRRLVQRRIDTIGSNPNIALIERSEYKRRWNTEPWEQQEARALRTCLLDRLEDKRHWPELRLTSCARLADRVRDDAEFLQVAELYLGRPDFDLTALVTELVEAESVPFLPVLRYTAAGLRKRAAWEDCWALQRREDANEQVGEIAVPPRYAAADFQKQSYWRLRGKLDVPKERFVLYLGAERDADRTPVLSWAGWNVREQAQALAAYFIDMKESEAWPAGRLEPLLAGLVELLPWLKQWHNDVDRETGVRMGDYYTQFVDEEARVLGLTADALRTWAPEATATRRRQRRHP
jgi:uncharacterized protein DUF7008/Eco57I restriction-modification methylase